MKDFNWIYLNKKQSVTITFLITSDKVIEHWTMCVTQIISINP